jgi:hypothetical protein
MVPEITTANAGIGASASAIAIAIATPNDDAVRKVELCMAPPSVELLRC